MKALPQISEAEFEVMKVIWKHAPISTNEITDKLTQTSKWSPKTIQTLIKRLVTKGALSYEKQSRVFVYTPLIEEKEYIGQESHSFLERYYDGDITAMLSAYGKGDKERRIQIGNSSVIHILEEYKNNFCTEIQTCQHFFVNQSGKPLSDQAIRRMINNYASLASIDLHITPHMFRHTFATSLLEADVDIRFIQEILGHSSINVTEIYTHVTVAKQKDILTTKHPRKDFHI